MGDTMDSLESSGPRQPSAMLLDVLWTQLTTPAAVVALDRVEANTARMSDRVRRLGARLRPHVKTHKCVEVARLQVREHFGGITVSTLAEARFFGEAGFRDVTYAVPIAAARLEEAVALASELDVLNVLIDHVDTLDAMKAVSRRTKTRWSVFLKVDCGYHRAGVDPESDDSVRLALRLRDAPETDFRGILTHAGHAYSAKTPAEIRAVGEHETSVMVGFAKKLADAGAPPSEISVGSTPTMSLSESLDGITEARAGNYVFYDRFQAAIGSCSLDDVAFAVLVSVTGHYPERNELLIDAGALAFSKDEGPMHIESDCGFGAILSVADGRHHEMLTLASLSQEHGKIRGREPIAFEQFPIGSKLRILPNHSCLSAALFDRYHVVHSDDVVDEWRPVRGW